MSSDRSVEEVMPRLEREFLSGVGDNSIKIQQCEACENFIFYPRIVCPSCWSTKLRWKEIGGGGTLYSYTEVHRGPKKFQAEIPYIVGIVTLDEGPRTFARIVGSSKGALKVGARVALSKVKKTGREILLEFKAQ